MNFTILMDGFHIRFNVLKHHPEKLVAIKKWGVDRSELRLSTAHRTSEKLLLT